MIYKLQDGGPSFGVTYPLKDISFEDIVAFVEAVRSAIGRIVVRSVEVECLGATNNIYNGNLRDLERALWKRSGELRKYTINFADRYDVKSRFLIYAPYLELAVRVRSREDRTSPPDICVGGRWCEEAACDVFNRLACSHLRLVMTETDQRSCAHCRALRSYRGAQLDDVLRRVTESAFLNRQYDTALRSAVSLVETRLRECCSRAGCVAAGSTTGHGLAVLAYHRDKGVLDPPWPIATEAREGAQLLVQGFFMYLRNALGHHTTVVGEDAESAIDLLLMCQAMLRIIDKSMARKREEQEQGTGAKSPKSP